MSTRILLVFWPTKIESGYLGFINSNNMEIIPRDMPKNYGLQLYRDFQRYVYAAIRDHENTSGSVRFSPYLFHTYESYDQDCAKRNEGIKSPFTITNPVREILLRITQGVISEIINSGIEPSDDYAEAVKKIAANGKHKGYHHYVASVAKTHRHLFGETLKNAKNEIKWLCTTFIDILKECGPVTGATFFADIDVYYKVVAFYCSARVHYEGRVIKVGSMQVLNKILGLPPTIEATLYTNFKARATTRRTPKPATQDSKTPTPTPLEQSQDTISGQLEQCQDTISNPAVVAALPASIVIQNTPELVVSKLPVVDDEEVIELSESGEAIQLSDESNSSEDDNSESS